MVFSIYFIGCISKRSESLFHDFNDEIVVNSNLCLEEQDSNQQSQNGSITSETFYFNSSQLSIPKYSVLLNGWIRVGCYLIYHLPIYRFLPILFISRHTQCFAPIKKKSQRRQIITYIFNWTVKVHYLRPERR